MVHPETQMPSSLVHGNNKDMAMALVSELDDSLSSSLHTEVDMVVGGRSVNAGIMCCGVISFDSTGRLASFKSSSVTPLASFVIPTMGGSPFLTKS